MFFYSEHVSIITIATESNVQNLFFGIYLPVFRTIEFCQETDYYDWLFV